MRSNRINNDDAQLVTEAVHWMVITAAYDPSLRAVKDKFADELARNDDVNKLKKLGCDKDKLLSTLAFANRMPALYPPLGANPLRNLARDLKSVLVRMKRLTPSRALPWFEDSTQKGKYILTFEPTGGDLHVWPELERELQLKAAAYEGLAGLVKSGRSQVVRPSASTRSCGPFNISTPFLATVLIRRGVVNGRAGDTKTEASRKPLPIDPRLAEPLQKLQKRSLHAGPQDWVFANRAGRSRAQQNILQRQLRPAAVRAAIGKIGWHTFRHSYSTMLRAAGADIKVQQELLRHSTIQSTMNIYTQAVSEQKRAANSTVVAILFNESASQNPANGS
jgi:hypothetical protein